MAVEKVAKEVLRGVITLFKDEKTQVGFLEYSLSYERSLEKNSAEREFFNKEHSATVVLNRATLDDKGWLQSQKGITHSFYNGVYQTSIPHSGRNGFPALPVALKNFHLPKKLRERLNELDDPLVKLVLEKYL